MYQYAQGVQKGLTATKKKNYFVTKADSNYETNRKNISFDCSFKKDTEKSLDSAQYDTVQNLTPRSMILWGT